MSRISPALALGIFLLSATGGPVALACTTDAECDNQDTCSLPDQCVLGSCILGGGGDLNDDLICDAEFDPTIDLRLTRIVARTSDKADGDTIRGAGDFIDLGSPGGAFTAADGIMLRAKDALSFPGVGTADDGFDVTVDFPPGACATKPSGSVVCVGAAGPLSRSRARFKPNRFAPNQKRFSFIIRGLNLKLPFFGPVRVILTHGTTRHRLGSVSDCRIAARGIRCHEF